MWQRKIVCMCIGLCLGWGIGTADVGAQESYRDLTFPELTFTLPDIEQQTLDNGMRLFLVEDHELPVIKLYALVKVGSIYEPEDKIGLAAIVSEVMRTGGTASYSADDVNETLEFLASEIEVAIQQELGTVEAWTLAKNFDTTLDIFADLLTSPVFHAEKVELAQAQMLEMIRRRNDEANEIVSREFLRLVYGTMHPLARIPQPATIQAITRADVVSFYSAYVHPNSVMLAVTGDFESAEMVTKLQTAFGAWDPQDVSYPDVQRATSDRHASVNLVPKNVEQATLMLGHLGIKSDNADYAAVTILDLILGSGGFSSRLYQRVRNDLGLAYSIGSRLGAGMRDDGAFMIYCGTGNENVAEAIRAIMAEIRDLREHQVSAEELHAAKNQYLNSFVFKFKTVDDVVRRRMFYDYFGYPADFLHAFRDRVMTITAADIQRAAQTYLHPDSMTILAVGDTNSFGSALREFGEVHILELEQSD